MSAVDSRDALTILNEAAREKRWPNVRPAPAATMIILDRSGAEPRVLMGRRHDGHKFMPGKFVFPGGRVEAGDRRMAAVGALDRLCEERLVKGVSRPGSRLPRALALAAIRETYEETGLMIGADAHGQTAGAEGTWQEFNQRGVFPDLESVSFIARAITPPRRPKRFDTRFFTVDATAITHRIDGMIGPESELVELKSVTLEEARQLDLPAITKVILGDLETRLAQGFGRHLPVPFYREVRGAFQREMI